MAHPRSLLAPLTTWLVALAVCAGLRAGTPATREFDIPAGEAEGALNQFIRQANVEVVYEVSQVKGAQTKTVKGAYTPRDALERLMAGTGLQILQDEYTGAMTIAGRSEAGPKNIAPPAPKKKQTPGSALAWRPGS